MKKQLGENIVFSLILGPAIHRGLRGNDYPNFYIGIIIKAAQIPCPRLTVALRVITIGQREILK
jgi:hypothetical protein